MHSLKGAAVSAGVGIGSLVVVPEVSFDTGKYEVTKENIDSEIAKVLDVTAKLKDILTKRSQATEGEQAEILQSHIMLLEDPAIISDIKKTIEDESANCEYSLSKVFEKYADMFFASGDELFMARAADLRDIKINLLTLLLGMELFEVSNVKAGSVLYAKELTTTIAAGIDAKNVCGIVTKEGGSTSHMAIIARSLGLPCVVNIEPLEGSGLVIVDGDKGYVVLNPDNATLAEYEKIQADAEKEKLALEKYRGLASKTTCGKHIELCCNVGLETEIEQAHKSDAQGIGLFRTEFLYMNRSSSPLEEEQFKIYKNAAQIFKEEPVIIRTLDVGGDKEIKYLGIDKEENPFLGFRAIRYCLKNKALFATQIRAILRASVYGNIKIMLPFVSQISELLSTRELIHDIMTELSQKGVDYNKNIDVGIMIETPAAAVMTLQFAKHADFFSIGTNDLTQYIMAVDRGNQVVANIYSDYQPAVLNCIFNISQAAKAHGIPCGICGESAANPLLTKFFIGSDISELSMATSSILNIKRVVRSTDYSLVKLKIEQNLDKLTDVSDTLDFLKSL